MSWDIQFHTLPEMMVDLEGEAHVGLPGPKGDTGATGPQGEAGKSAYQYAQEGGYSGTEADFIKKMADTSSGIHIGTEEPTDQDVHVWIDTDAEPEDSCSSIDVTAEVGQTIIVKAVDESGKPTEWEAVEYQPRTHYKKVTPTVFLEETSGQSGDAGVGAPIMAIMQQLTFKEGTTYDVTFNGVTYPCVAYWSPMMNRAVIGNPAFHNIFVGGEVFPNTGEPFNIFYYPSYNCTLLVTAEAMDITVSIVENSEEVTPIPNEYVDNMFLIRMWGGGSAGAYHIDRTWQEIYDALTAGKMVCLQRQFIEIRNGVSYQAREEYRFIYGHYGQANGYIEFASYSTSNIIIECTDGVMTIT